MPRMEDGRTVLRISEQSFTSTVRDLEARSVTLHQFSAGEVQRAWDNLSKTDLYFNVDSIKRILAMRNKWRPYFGTSGIGKAYGCVRRIQLKTSSGGSSGACERRSAVTRLLYNLLEVEVVHSSKRKDLNKVRGRGCDEHPHRIPLFTMLHAPLKYHSCPGQAKTWGTSHPHPRGQTRIPPKTWPK